MDDKQAKFLGMVYAYRALGHTIAKFNPLISEPLHNPRLTLERLDLRIRTLIKSITLEIIWRYRFIR